MIKLKIDNKAVTVHSATKIIQIADQLSIYIPRVCYHQELSIAGHCGMCAVEIINYPDLVPACATTISHNMQIYTNSSRVIANRQKVLEQLLRSHPLDCPVCEKSGECSLQDLAFQHAKTSSLPQTSLLLQSELNLGALLSTKMRRCIYCTKCVRFSREIAGDQQLIVNFQGLEKDLEKTIISQNITANSGLVGNMLDLCPVGAIVPRSIDPIKPWEVTEKSGISMHDSLGSNLKYKINHSGIIKAVVPQDQPEINKMWLSDRDRFGFLAINAVDRLKYPMIKTGERWQIATWEQALELAASKLTAIISKHGGKQLGGLISPNATLEEGLYFKALLQQLGSNNLDHRLHQIDFSQPNQEYCYPYLNLDNISQLAEQKVILLIGSWIQEEQPLAAMYVRAASLRNGKIIVINPLKFKGNFNINLELIAERADMLPILLQLYKAMLTLKNLACQVELQKLIEKISYTQDILQAAEILLQADPKKITIVLGFLAISHPKFTKIMAISHKLSELLGANFGCIPIGANSLGLDLVRRLPAATSVKSADPFLGTGKLLDHLISSVKFSDQCTDKVFKNINILNTKDLLQQPLKSYMLFGIEPELDSIYATAGHTLKRAEFILAFSAFESKILMQYADVLLPIALPPETGGTYINVTGKIQEFAAVAAKPGESQSGVEAMLNIAKNYGIKLTLTDESIQIKNMLANLKNRQQLLQYDLNFTEDDLRTPDPNINLIRIASLGTYAVDPVVRRVRSLQLSIDAKKQIWINPIDAQRLRLNLNATVIIMVLDHDGQTLSNHKTFRIQFGELVPLGCVLLPQVNEYTAVSLPYQTIRLKVVKMKVLQD